VRGIGALSSGAPAADAGSRKLVSCTCRRTFSQVDFSSVPYAPSCSPAPPCVAATSVVGVTTFLPVFQRTVATFWGHCPLPFSRRSLWRWSPPRHKQPGRGEVFTFGPDIAELLAVVGLGSVCLGLNDGMAEAGQF
jgi:hypothetical protein